MLWTLDKLVESSPGPQGQVADVTCRGGKNLVRQSCTLLVSGRSGSAGPLLLTQCGRDHTVSDHKLPSVSADLRRASDM
jgi:hypothetical protein